MREEYECVSMCECGWVGCGECCANSVMYLYVYRIVKIPMTLLHYYQGNWHQHTSCFNLTAKMMTNRFSQENQ